MGAGGPGLLREPPPGALHVRVCITLLVPQSQILGCWVGKVDGG